MRGVENETSRSILKLKTVYYDLATTLCIVYSRLPPLLYRIGLVEQQHGGSIQFIG